MSPPDKPELGAQCNGCGACCLAEKCHMGLAVYGDRAGACPGARWDGGKYRCAVYESAPEDQRGALRLIVGFGFGCDSEL